MNSGENRVLEGKTLQAKLRAERFNLSVKKRIVVQTKSNLLLKIFLQNT